MGDVTAIEKGLRQALRHVPAPEGFADRVMARAAASGARSGRRGGTGPLLHMHPAAAWWSAMAAALLLALGGGDALHLHNQHRAQQEQAAQAEVDRALRLTNHALNEVTVNLDRSHAGRFTRLWNETVQ